MRWEIEWTGKKMWPERKATCYKFASVSINKNEGFNCNARQFDEMSQMFSTRQENIVKASRLSSFIVRKTKKERNEEIEMEKRMNRSIYPFISWTYMTLSDLFDDVCSNGEALLAVAVADVDDDDGVFVVNISFWLCNRFLTWSLSIWSNQGNIDCLSSSSNDDDI